MWTPSGPQHALLCQSGYTCTCAALQSRALTCFCSFLDFKGILKVVAILQTSASIRLHALVLMSSGYGPVEPQRRRGRFLVYGPSPAGPPPATPAFTREDHWREEVERNQAIIQVLEQQHEDQRQLVASLRQREASLRQHISLMERRYEERWGPLPSEASYRSNYRHDRMESDIKMEA